MTDKTIQQDQQNPTISEVFKPTPAMIKWVDTAIQIADMSPSKISEASGLDRTNWYDWIKNDEFVKWFRTEWDKRIKAFAPYLDMIGIQKASKDFKFWESMQHRVGNLQDSPKSMQQINVGGEAGNNITFVNFKDESTS
jgi:hypothetical protein